MKTAITAIILAILSWAPLHAQDNELSVDKARFLYETSLKTVSSQDGEAGGAANFFKRVSDTVNWDDAAETSSAKAYRVNAPTSSSNEYIALLQNGDGYYFSKCTHDISVIMSREDGRTTVYNHFLIPFRIMEDGDSLPEGLVEYKGPGISDFSGLEIYSTIDGKVAAINRYHSGTIYESAFIDYGEYGDEWVSYMLRYHLRKLYIIGKDELEERMAKGPEERYRDAVASYNSR